MTLVLDASTTLSFALDDEFDDRAKGVLSRVAAEGALVPTLWEFEVLNGLRSAERRGRLTEAALVNAWRALAGLPIERDRRSADGLSVIALARQFQLSAYDAAYLWLAMDANVPLATSDSVLMNAATSAGVLVL